MEVFQAAESSWFLYRIGISESVVCHQRSDAHQAADEGMWFRAIQTYSRERRQSSGQATQ